MRVTDLRRLAGGASREIWSLDVTLERAPGQRETLPLVLRKDPPGRVGDGGDRGTEFRVLRAAHRGGVCVPRVYWAGRDPAMIGAPFFLMERIAGETLPRRLLRDERYARARAGMTAELGAILARIHALDLADPDLADLSNLANLPDPANLADRADLADVSEPADLAKAAADRSPARSEVERTVQGIRELAVDPHPVLDLAERWLLARAPAPPRLALVHGDYRIGNVVFDETGVRAILDWELIHIGDPIEDLGWLCTRAWRFGAPLPVGGIGTREELIDAYERESGTRVDRDALRFWEAFGSFKLALVFLMQSRVYLDGRVCSVELASLGRRTVEAEDELLRFLREDA